MSEVMCCSGSRQFCASVAAVGPLDGEVVCTILTHRNLLLSNVTLQLQQLLLIKQSETSSTGNIQFQKGRRGITTALGPIIIRLSVCLSVCLGETHNSNTDNNHLVCRTMFFLFQRAHCDVRWDLPHTVREREREAAPARSTPLHI